MRRERGSGSEQVITHYSITKKRLASVLGGVSLLFTKPIPIMKTKLFFCALFATLLLTSCDSKEEGTISGVFSVSATQQVKFSSGNLQYTKSTKTFQFAEHQWTVLGNKDADFDEKDTFDLFAWGSGDNPSPERLESEEARSLQIGVPILSPMVANLSGAPSPTRSGTMCSWSVPTPSTCCPTERWRA